LFESHELAQTLSTSRALNLLRWTGSF